MKKLFSIALLILMTFTVLLNVSCDKTEENKDEPKKEEPSNKPEEPDDGEDNDSESDYVYLEKQDSLAEWDAIILGKDQIHYLFKSKNELPERFLIWNEKKDSIPIFLQFDDKGYPLYMIANQYTLVFDNFRGNAFDLAIVEDKEVISRADSIICDINWDRYPNEILKTKAGHFKRNSQILTVVSEAVGCGISASVAMATGGLSIPLALIDCSSALLTIVDIACDQCLPPWLTNLSTAVGCVNSLTDLTKIAGCLRGVITNWVSVAADVKDIYDRHEEVKKAKGILSLSVDAIVKKIGVNSASIVLPISHYIDPKYLEGAKIEVGIFFSKEQPFPAGATIKDTSINWWILSGGNEVSGKIDLEGLEPNTTYYYMPYINFNLSMAYGQINKFKTKDNYNLIGTWETESYEHHTPGGEILKERIVHVFDRYGNYTMIWNYDKERYSYYFIQDLVNQNIHKLDQCKYTEIGGTYSFDEEKMCVKTVCTSFVDYWDEIETRTKEGHTVVTKNSGSSSNDDYLGQDFFAGDSIVFVNPTVIKSVKGNGYQVFWKIKD